MQEILTESLRQSYSTERAILSDSADRSKSVNSTAFLELTGAKILFWILSNVSQWNNSCRLIDECLIKFHLQLTLANFFLFHLKLRFGTDLGIFTEQSNGG